MSGSKYLQQCLLGLVPNQRGTNAFFEMIISTPRPSVVVQDNFTFELSLNRHNVVQSFLKTWQIFLPFCRPFAHDRLSKAIFHSVVTRLKLKTFYPRRLANRSISEKL